MHGEYENHVGWTERVGTIACCKCTGTSGDWRFYAYSSFDTSSIGAEPPTWIKTDLVYYFATVSEGVTCDVSSYKMRVYYEDDVIGVAVTADEVEFANFAVEEDYGPSPPATGSHTVSLPSATINPTGDTDLEFRGWNTWVDCADGPVYCIRNRWFGPSWPTYLDLEWETGLQGLTNRIPTGNIPIVGMSFLMLLREELLKIGAIPRLSSLSWVVPYETVRVKAIIVPGVA